MEGLTQHLPGSLMVHGASAAADIKVIIDSGLSIIAMSKGLVQAVGEGWG